MQLNVVQINSSLFNHFPKTKRLVAEISDIQLLNFQRLYDDAADMGFALRNPKTGNVTRWAVAKEVRNDGEIMGWSLVPTPESIQRQPVLEGYCITLLND